MSTNVLSAKNIKRDWQIVDAKDKIVGRLATKVATILQGKHKSNYVPYLDNGDFVIVTNAAYVRISGRKSEQKQYIRHSGYPGGLKKESFTALQKRRPTEIIRHAVKGMLPKTKLGDKMIKKLYIYPESEHPHQQVKEGKQDGTTK